MNLNFEDCLNLKKLAYYQDNKAFRTTCLTLKKHPKHQKYSFKNPLKKQSQQANDPNNKLIIQNQFSEKEANESSFIKQYIEKIKNEGIKKNDNFHKKRNLRKKIKSNEDASLPLCRNKKQQKITLFDSINRDGNNALNTVSIVSKDLYEIANYGQGKGRKIYTPVQNPSWTKRDKINQIINDMRKNSTKQLSTDHILQGRAEYIQRDIARKILVSRRKQIRRFSNFKLDKPQGKKQHIIQNFKVLEPWNEDKIVGDFSIEQYGRI